MSRTTTVLHAVCQGVMANRDRLNELDAAIGDGDHGVSMAKTFAAVDERLDDLVDEEPAVVLDRVGAIILTSVGGAMGPLFGSAFKAAGRAFADEGPGPGTVADAIVAARDRVAALGGASVGDKTMLDALDPAGSAATRAAAAGGDLVEVITAAAEGAEAGALRTKDMRAAVGRASRLGDRTIGSADPGATSVAIMLRAAADAVSADATQRSHDTDIVPVTGGST